MVLEQHIFHSQTLHLLIAVCSGYMTAIFGWWWIKHGAASRIYMVTTFLMAGLALTHCGAWAIYQEMSIANATQVMVTPKWWWPYRNYPTLITVIIYAVHISRKAFGKKTPKRRMTDL